MTFSRRTLIGTALAAGLLSGSAAAQETTLKFAHWAAPNHTLQPTVIDPLSETVTAESDGAIAIDVYPGGELGPGPTEQYMRAMTGVADFVWGLAGYTSSQFPLSMLMELPGVVEEAGGGYTAIWRVYDTYLADEFPGTRPIALWSSEPNILIMADDEIRTVEDLAGLKIRVSGSVPGRTIEALGATPVQMPATEMYTALQTGLIDGVMTGASAVRDFRLNEIADVYIQGPNLGRILFYVVMNQGAYDGLDDAGKAAIDAAAGETLSQSGEDGWNRVAEETLAELEADESKTVITLSEQESAPFNAITADVRQTVISELDAEGLPASDVVRAMTGTDG